MNGNNPYTAGVFYLNITAHSSYDALAKLMFSGALAQILYSKHYGHFDTFRNSINNRISDLGTRFKSEMQSLMTMNFQLF
ncbi:MAG: hypothetical protein ACXWAT_04620 [Methylobacter sp.]